MQIKYINSLIDNIIDTDDSYFDKGNLFIFKSLKDSKTQNPNINLKYEILNVDMGKSNVILNTKNLLRYLKNSKINDNTNFLKYHVNNPHKSVDYMFLENFNFEDAEIQNGNLSDLSNHNHYKVQFLLDKFNDNIAPVSNCTDFDTMRYTCSLATILKNNKTHNIYIINKCKPLIKAKNAYYIYDPEVDREINPTLSQNNASSKFKLIEKRLFKMPYYPSLLIIDNFCLFIDNNIEAIFGFEEYNKKICKQTVKNIFDSFSLDTNTEKFLSSLSNIKKFYNLFSDFDNTRLNNLFAKTANDDINILKNGLKLNFEIKSEPNKNELILENKKQAGDFLKFISNHIKRELTSDALIEVPKSSPLNT